MIRNNAHFKEGILNRPVPVRYQKGGLTIFTGVFVLVLLTMMLLYAARVGVVEQRISGNEQSQKLAFHAAETAVEQGLEYIGANAGRIFSNSTQAVQTGASTYLAGWFAGGSNVGWASCNGHTAKDNHPCGGDIPATNTSWFYDDPTTTTGTDSLPLNNAIFAADTTARLTAVMCIVDSANPTGTCQGAPGSEEEEQEASAVFQLLGYGFTDCVDASGNGAIEDNELASCTGRASISQPMTNYKNLQGKPSVPLTTKSTFPPTGTAEVVGNPNGGGLGVPLTTWINSNAACAPATNVQSSGSWQTCELGDWYEGNVLPDDAACDAIGNCSCGPGGNDTSYFLSWRNASDTNVGIDIVIDDSFPCDLFEFYFGVPRSQYAVIKGSATVISNCTGLNAYSSGLYWASGSVCQINANTQVGTHANPIMLVSAATSTDLRGGAEIFGVLYVFDGEDINATMNSTGTNTVYGAVVVDAVIGQYQGTFQIVWADGVLADASGLNGIGNFSGGWRDFGLPEWN